MNKIPHTNSDDNQAALVQHAADLSAKFQAVFEEYLIAVIQANYDKSDEQILEKLVESRKKALVSSANYHAQLAKVEEHPIVARQHKLLAAVYDKLHAKLSGLGKTTLLANQKQTQTQIIKNTRPGSEALITKTKYLST